MDENARELPHRDLDPVLTLYAHYFLAADLNLRNYEATANKARKRKSLGSFEWQLPIYYRSWLGFLGVTCEGFRRVNPWLTLQKRPKEFEELFLAVSDITGIIKKHENGLREFRNCVFHLTENTDDNLRFPLDCDHRQWATDLHMKLEKFFSDYRIACHVVYYMNDRWDEASIKSQRGRPAATD